MASVLIKRTNPPVTIKKTTSPSFKRDVVQVVYVNITT